ncbi:uncharacterized protein LOC142159941 [Mixophyes fleayi]|uniref:uncharacterized protein LOC142159941 n=1 Tax=Mixophyes fleayi TaxID=3061075 RepID=UPI003F4E3EA7
MEEWEYLEGHKDLYKDVMMENHQPLTSLDGSSNRNTPERCSSPLNLHHGTEENHHIPEDYQIITEDDQSEDLINIKAEAIEGEEEIYMRCDQQYKNEESLTDIGTNEQLRSNISEGRPILSPDCEIEDTTQDSQRENTTILNMHQILYSAHISSDYSSYGESFPKNEDIVIHNTYIANRGDKGFACSECGKCFAFKSIFVEHKRIHTGEKPFSCSKCRKCFALKSNLFQHQKVHTGEKPFSCSNCNRCFAQKSQLVIHQRTHTGEKPFPCCECGKFFAQKSNLVKHQRMHSDGKTFTCFDCGKYFASKAVLVKHQKIHKCKKPFSCSDCGRCFTHNSLLVKHQIVHTGEKPFPCFDCGKCFARKSHLFQHQRMHTGEKPFQCSYCGKCFAQKSNLIVHQRIHTALHV